MTTSIQKMQTNDLLHSSAAAQFVRSPHLLASDIHSQLNMLYAITQQQMSSSSPPDLAMVSKAKRIKKTIPTNHEPPSMVSATSSRSNSTSDREIVKVVTTAGPQNVDKEFLTQLLSRKDVIPARKRRDFIPNEMKDDHYWERRRKNNLAAKRSREKRRLNDIVLETKVVELSNENDLLRAKLHLMLSRLDMKETDMEVLFEEEQRLGHICLKPVTSASTILTQHQQRIGTSDDDEHSSRSTVPKNSSSSETHEDDDDEEIQENGDARCQHPILYNQLLGSNNNSSNGVVDLSRTEVKTGNLLTTVTNKSPSPLTPSPSPPDESLLQILANQILKNKQSETMPSTAPSSRLLTIASPPESKNSLKRNFSQIQQDDEQQQKKWDEAAVTLLSLNKPPPPPQPVVEQQTALQSVCQSVINGLLRKPAPPRATIDYHSNAHFHHQAQHLQGENLHHRQQESITSLAQLKTLMNYFSTTSNGSLSIPSLLQQHQQQQQQAICVPENTNATAIVHSQQQQQQQQHEHRGDAMPLKLRMKMLNAKS